MIELLLRSRLPRAALAAGLLLLAAPAPGQEEDETLVDGVLLENAIVGRDVAVRLRGELQITTDDADLLEDDVNYARFPARMITGEARMFQSDRLSFTGLYALWQNAQDLDMRLWSYEVRAPLRLRPDPRIPPAAARTGVEPSWRELPTYVYFRYRQIEEPFEDGTDVCTRYAYLAFSRSFPRGFYLYTQYRQSHADDEDDLGHQLSAYGTWKPGDRFRLGQQLVGTFDDNGTGFGSGSVRLFASFALVEGMSSLRLDGRHYSSNEADTDSDEYNAYLYQMVGRRSFVRFGYRRYDDTDGFSSNAWSVKFKHYVSPRLALHAGYRWYDHEQGDDFDSFLGGFSLFL